MRKVNWLIVGITGILVIWLFVGGTMMMDGWGMMKNWGYSSTSSLLGWIGMIFKWLVPASLIVLAAFGVVWLASNIRKFRPPSS